VVLMEPRRVVASAADAQSLAFLLLLLLLQLVLERKWAAMLVATVTAPDLLARLSIAQLPRLRLLQSQLRVRSCLHHLRHRQLLKRKCPEQLHSQRLTLPAALCLALMASLPHLCLLWQVMVNSEAPEQEVVQKREAGQ